MRLQLILALTVVMATVGCFANAGVGTSGKRKAGMAMIGLQCPQLDRNAVRQICVEGPARLSFTDGCNRMRCLPGGGAASTRRRCRPADVENSPQESFACRRIIVGLAAAAGVGHCRQAGDDAQSGSVFCRLLLSEQREDEGEEIFETTDGSGSGSAFARRRRNRDQQQPSEYACPNLSIDRICGRSTNGFIYSDGCNQIACHADGTGQTTFKVCPQPEAGDSAGQEYCREAERRMRDKMQMSKLRSRCLEPEQVCRDNRRIVYNNGCNRCICWAPGEASCTRRGCPSVLMTDDDFATYCERKGAGVH